MPNEIIIGSNAYNLSGAICYCYIDPEHETVEYDFYLADKVYWDNNGNWKEEDSYYANGVEVNIYTLFAKGVAEGKLPTGKFTYGDAWEHMKHTGDSDYLLLDENGSYDDWIEFSQDDVKESNLTIEIKHINGNIYEIYSPVVLMKMANL